MYICFAIYTYLLPEIYFLLFLLLYLVKIDVLAVVVDTKGVREGLHTVDKLDAVLCNF